jgi:excisionase family DNA binding protein
MAAEVNRLRFGLERFAPRLRPRAAPRPYAQGERKIISPRRLPWYILGTARRAGIERSEPRRLPEDFRQVYWRVYGTRTHGLQGETGLWQALAALRNLSERSELGPPPPSRFGQIWEGLRRPRVTPELQSLDLQGRTLPRLLSVRETASLLGVCTSTVYKLCANGALRHVRVSNAIRIPEGALSSYV